MFVCTLCRRNTYHFELAFNASIKKGLTVRLAILASSAFLCLCAPALAHADMFTLTSGADTISFSAPASPIPSTTDTVNQFSLDNVTFDVDGVPSMGDIYFYTSAVGGGLEVVDGIFMLPLVSQTGPQVFTGAVTAPTFLPGNFSLQAYGDGSVFDGNFSLTILPDMTATPEPASLLLVGSGLLSITSVIRRRFTK